MTWNLMHLARMLHAAGGIPAYGNIRSRVGRRVPIRFRQSRIPLSSESFPSLASPFGHSSPATGR